MTGQDEDRALDDVDTPETALPPVVGNWLHFDVQTACAGDMLCAALLNLGVSSAILRDGLARVGLHPAVGPRLTQTKRNGVAGLHLCFVKRDGHAVDGGVLDPPSAFVPPKDHPRGRHRLRQPTLRTRTALQVAEAGVEQETERETAEVITLHHGQPSAEVGAPAPDDVMRWLDGQAATGEALERRLAQGRLSPIAAAISRKALRRLLDGLAQVQGIARRGGARRARRRRRPL